VYRLAGVHREPGVCRGDSCPEQKATTARAYSSNVYCIRLCALSCCKSYWLATTQARWFSTDQNCQSEGRLSHKALVKLVSCTTLSCTEMHRGPVIETAAPGSCLWQKLTVIGGTSGADKSTLRLSEMVRNHTKASSNLRSLHRELRWYEEIFSSSQWKVACAQM
jgi:hypothetical protein